MHDPYAEPDKQPKGEPGPHTYQITRDFDVIPESAFEEDEFSAPKFRHVLGGKVYVEDNNDRFGQPLMPSKPVMEVPGPGTYHPFCEVNDMGMQSLPFEPAKQFAHALEPRRENCMKEYPQKTAKGVPGPAKYGYVGKEPEKISFLFNPAEKWV